MSIKITWVTTQKVLFYVTIMTYLYLPQEGFGLLKVSKENTFTLPVSKRRELFTLKECSIFGSALLCIFLIVVFLDLPFLLAGV